MDRIVKIIYQLCVFCRDFYKYIFEIPIIDIPSFTVPTFGISGFPSISFGGIELTAIELLSSGFIVFVLGYGIVKFFVGIVTGS